MMHPHDPDFYNVAFLVVVVSIPAIIGAGLYDQRAKLRTVIGWSIVFLLSEAMMLAVILLWPLMRLVKLVSSLRQRLTPPKSGGMSRLLRRRMIL